MSKKGPLLIAANHPNSFLDAIILASLFKHPVYSLARGDAFVNGFVGGLLRSLNMLPIYRISEGSENLSHNFITFEACNKIFQNGGIVLIFSEGRCINEWHLRPLKKGTARISLAAWNRQIPLEIIPLGINYNKFRSFGKNVHLNFGNVISEHDINYSDTEGKKISELNTKLYSELQSLVYEISADNEIKRDKLFVVPVSPIKKILLYLPSLFGKLVHLPLYESIKLIIKNKANDHYDSIIVGMLFIFYPIYFIILTSLSFVYFPFMWACILMVFIPFSSWAYLQLKDQ